MSDAMAEFNQKVIEEFRSSGGKVGGAFAGAPMIIVTHTGAKSGRTHTTPLVYSKDGDRYVIIASKAGSPTNPAWYHNLIAHPDVTAEIGTATRAFRARTAPTAEREPIWRKQKHDYPGFADYEKKTSREIPVVILEPA
jgi:deazaflavin-dependent oxidoreductase (nitroreductase family)